MDLRAALQICALLVITALGCMSMHMLYRRKISSSLTIMAIMVVTVIVFPIFINMVSSPKPSDDKSAAPSATKSPITGESAPDSSYSELDLSSFWPIAGTVASIVGIGILATILIFLIRKSRLMEANLEASLKEQKMNAAADRAKALAVWQKSVDKHNELKSKVLQIETDWDMLFSYPALVDTSVPQTRVFHQALQAVDSASSEAPSDISLTMDISTLPYPQLVASADRAWQSAWSFAQKTGTRLIPRAERKKVDQIMKLLKLAQSSGGSEHERSTAYSRAEKLIAELQFVKVPAAALKSISAEARLMIEAAPQTADSSAPEQVLTGNRSH